MSDKYILDGHKAVKANLKKWAKWYETTDRQVAMDIIVNISVSTVFLGLDHSFGDGPPLLFETRVFGGALDQEQERYTTWEQAEAGHKEMVKRVLEAL
uniref:Uncharacterized protein n=1 Tax=viral metagenome TaxID=1070528 RepID=A0A6M3JQR8_9ZZZZ